MVPPSLELQNEKIEKLGETVDEQGGNIAELFKRLKVVEAEQAEAKQANSPATIALENGMLPETAQNHLKTHLYMPSTIAKAKVRVKAN